MLIITRTIEVIVSRFNVDPFVILFSDIIIFMISSCGTMFLIFSHLKNRNVDDAQMGQVRGVNRT